MKSHAGQSSAEGLVRPCGAQDRSAVLRIINRAAEAYRGVIPEDRFHDPYMSEQELAHEMADGVIFCGYEVEGLVGVMGVQAKANVDLIRHAYVLPGRQGGGVGSALLAHLRRRTERPILVGAWRAAGWAIGFYERRGFHRVPDEDVAPLLRTYWKVPDRQVETSVVLAAPRLAPGDAARLIAASAPAPA